MTVAVAERKVETKLSPREVEILQLVGEGKTRRDIALQLECAEATVKTHLDRLRIKLKAANLANAVYIGVKQELI